MQSALRKVLLAVCKAYGVFAALHVLYKIISQARLLMRARKHLGALPGAANGFGLKFDLLGLGILKNMNSYYDYRAQPGLAHPDAPLVTGPGPFVEVFANNRAAIKHLLKDDFMAFTKADGSGDYVMHLLGEFLGDSGIFVIQHGKDLGSAHLDAAHEKWHRMRKTGSKIFTKSAFSSLVMETFLEKTRVMRSTLRDASASGEPLDMQQMFFRFTADSIQRIFYNREVDTVSGKESDAYACAFDNAHRALTQIYMKYIPVHVLAQMLLPYPFGTLGRSGSSLAMRAVHALTPEGHALRENLKFLAATTDDIVREARADPNLASRRDLLANYLNSGDDYTDKELRDIVLNFIIAGRDTTACTLSWLMFELCSHPDVQAKIHEEIDRVLGADGEPTYEICARELPFLTGCIYETLRLHPPVPEDPKVAMRDSVFQGVIIPKGSKMTFHNYTLGRNPLLYPDPLAFKPGRWIDEQGQSKKLDTFATPVFQAGYRECLGKEAALMEVKTVASMLLQEFRFTMTDDVKASVGWALMITMSISNSPDRTSSHKLMLTPHARR